MIIKRHLVFGLALGWGSVLFPLEANAWGQGHSKITRAAVEVLPDWEREMLAPCREKLVTEYCLYPDQKDSPAAKPYNFTVSGRHFHYMPLAGPKENREYFSQGAALYLKTILGSLEKGSVEEAAKFLGAFMHVLQDAGHPGGHSLEGIDGVTFRQLSALLPPPDGAHPSYSPDVIFQAILDHDAQKDFVVAITGYQPQILGTSLDEITFHLYERYVRAVRKGRAAAAPAYQHWLNQRQPELVKTLTAPAEECGRTCADLAHTVLALAKKRVGTEDLATLQKVDLTTVEPVDVPVFTAFPYRFTPMVLNCSLGRYRKKYPLELWVAEEGVREKKTFERGLSMAMVSVKYVIPPGVYSRFEVLAGIHAALGADDWGGKRLEKEAPAAFTMAVVLNGRKLWESGVLQKDAPAQSVGVPVAEGGLLELVCQNRGASEVNHGNQPVWANPVLVRQRQPLDQAATATSEVSGNAAAARAASSSADAPRPEIRKDGLGLKYNPVTGQLTEMASSLLKSGTLALNADFQVFVQDEQEPEGKWLLFEKWKPVVPPAPDAAHSSLTSRYSSAEGEGEILASTTVEIKDARTIRWAIQVANQSRKSVLRVRYPVLKNLGFSEGGKNDEILWPLLTTILIRNPAQFLRKPTDPALLNEPIHYPRACVNFVDLSGEGKGLGLIGDPSLVMNEFGCSTAETAGAIDLRIDMVNQIPPGGKADYRFVTRLHEGNWRKTADFYREGFYQQYPQPTYPDWLRRSNGYLAVYWGSDFPPRYGSETREHINEAWRLGLDHLQFWGHTGMHACPGYPLPDPLRGGEAGMQDMIRMIRDAGLHAGTYFYGDGMSKFEVLSPSYRGVKWEELPPEVRPPSWQWLVENSLYATAKREPPSKEITSRAWQRAKVKTIEEAAEKKLDPQALHAMSFQSADFRKWLQFWVLRYAAAYGTDTPYLDVYGHRPKYSEYNPYLRKFGDGAEGRLRYEFLRDLVAIGRKQDPAFVPMMEGALDAYQVYAPALVSNNRRFMEGYRYTFPEHILYEGLANGWWVHPKSREAIANAFLDGNHFDLILSGCNTTEVERMIWMRESLMPWVARGIYQGYLGFDISSDKLQGALLDARQFLGSSVINIRNISNIKDARLTLSLDLAKPYSAAYLIPLWGPITRITDLNAPITLPDTTVSSVLLVQQASHQGAVIPFLLPEKTAQGQRYDLRVINPGKADAPFQVDVIFHDKKDKEIKSIVSGTVPSGEVFQAFYSVPESEVGDRVEKLLFSLTSGAAKFSFRRTWDPLIEDPCFEWREDIARSAEFAKDGKSSFIVTKQSQPLLLKLAPHTSYQIKFFAYKPEPAKSYALITDPKTDKTLAVIRGSSDTLPHAWSELTGSFQTGEEGRLKLYLKNDGEKPVYCDGVRIEAVR